MALPIDENEIGEVGQEILKDVVVESFEVSPQTIEPFEEVQLSWKVTGPDPRFGVQLNGAQVGKTGRATDNPLGTIVYKLEGIAFGQSALLGQVSVVVSHDNCLQNGIGQGLIQTQVRDEIEKFIQPGGEIAVRSPARVTVDNGRIEIGVFLKIVINNFFDGDLDLTLKFSLGLTPGRSVRARLLDVDADVKFHIAEHILSLGGASLVQGVAQVTVRACVKAFLGPQLEDLLASKLQQLIGELCRAADRDRILSISASDGEIRFECCRLSREAQFTDVLQLSAVLA